MTHLKDDTHVPLRGPAAVKQRLRESFRGDLRLLLGDQVATELLGGSLEEPLVLTLVVSEQSYRLVAWGECTETPQWSDVAEQLQGGVKAAAWHRMAYLVSDEGKAWKLWQ